LRASACVTRWWSSATAAGGMRLVASRPAMSVVRFMVFSSLAEFRKATGSSSLCSAAGSDGQQILPWHGDPQRRCEAIVERHEIPLEIVATFLVEAGGESLCRPVSRNEGLPYSLAAAVVVDRLAILESEIEIRP